MGLFKSLANFVKDSAEDFAKIKKETYEQIQTEHWYDIYRMLKSKGASSVVSAKVQGTIWALQEKLHNEQDIEQMKEIYEYEKNHFGERDNVIGFSYLKRAMEDRNLI